MSSARRQICYWTISLTSVFTYRIAQLLDPATTAQTIIFYGFWFLLFGAVLEDGAFEDTVLWQREFLYRSATGLGLVLLGYAAEVCNEIWYANLHEDQGKREALMHLLLSVVCLAQIEYWRHRVG